MHGVCFHPPPSLKGGVQEARFGRCAAKRGSCGGACRFHCQAWQRQWCRFGSQCRSALVRLRPLRCAVAPGSRRHAIVVSVVSHSSPPIDYLRVSVPGSSTFYQISAFQIEQVIKSYRLAVCIPGGQPPIVFLFVLVLTELYPTSCSAQGRKERRAVFAAQRAF